MALTPLKKTVSADSLSYEYVQVSIDRVKRTATLTVSAPKAALPTTPDAMLAQGAEVVYTTPEEFDRFQRAEIVKWSKVIRDAKLQAQ